MSEKAKDLVEIWQEEFKPNKQIETSTADKPNGTDRTSLIRIISGTTQNGILFRLEAVVFADTEKNADRGKVGKVVAKGSIKGSYGVRAPEMSS